jgi:hypothetical protein
LRLRFNPGKRFEAIQRVSHVVGDGAADAARPQPEPFFKRTHS